MLKLPMFGEAPVAIVADDEVIQEGQLHQAACLFQLARDRAILWTRLGISRRMIVRADDGRRAMLERALDDFAGVDGAGVDGAPEQLLDGQDLVLAVQKEHGEDFVIQIAHRVGEELIDVIGISDLSLIHI